MQGYFVNLYKVILDWVEKEMMKMNWKKKSYQICCNIYPLENQKDGGDQKETMTSREMLQNLF